MLLSDLDSHIGPVTLHSREVEMLGIMGKRAGRSVPISIPCDTGKNSFHVGDEVLVAKDAATNTSFKWPAFGSKFYGPCKVIAARHPRYTLRSLSGRISRNEVHAQRLILYHRRPNDRK